MCMDGWDRVIAAVIDRRSELHWTQKRLAEEAGVSERTVQNLEGGRRPQPINRRKIEKALGWEAGAFRRIESEPEPESEPDPLPGGLRAAIRDFLPPDRAAVVEAAVEAALRGDPPPAIDPGRRAEAG